MSAIIPDSDSEDELPPAWEERVALDGSVYYVNHATKLSQWTHPRTGKKKVVTGKLPSGWEKIVDESGKIRFYDQTHQRTTFTDPRLAFATQVKDHNMDVRQRFDGSSTALQVLLGCDLSGKTFFITGATNGIGLETAQSLAQHGATVIICGRSEATCNMARSRILEERPQSVLDILPMDLSSLASVKMAGEQLRSKYEKLDVVILNAGVFAIDWQLTEDGLESLFQINHLSHFYLTLIIEPLLQRGSRLVLVSSESHRQSLLKPLSLNIETLSPNKSNYWGLMAYNNSKLCNILHALELSDRLRDRGVDVMALHPGNMISTGIAKRSCLFRFLFALVRPFTKSLQQGAATTVYCAVAPELSGCSGAYFNNCCLTKCTEAGRNAALARQLWDLSVKLLRERNLPLTSELL